MPVVVLLPLAVRQVTTRSLGGRCVKGLPALSVPLVSMDYPLHYRECHARSAHAVRTQCEVLDVGKYLNPSFGPFSQASVEAVRFALQSTLPDR